MRRTWMAGIGGIVAMVVVVGTAVGASSGAPFRSAAAAQPTVPNDVRVRVDASTPGPCANQPGVAPPHPPGAERLPAPAAPTGVQLQMNGGGGPNRSTSDARALTDRRAGASETHFAQQVRAAGWTRVAGEATGPLAWSTGKVPGEGRYEGCLSAMDAPGQNRTELPVQVESASASFGGGTSPPTAPMPPVAPTPTVVAPVSAHGHAGRVEPRASAES